MTPPPSSPRISRRTILAGGMVVLIGTSALHGQPQTELIDAAAFRRAGRSDLEVLRLAVDAWQKARTGTLRLEANRKYDLGRITAGPDLFAISGLEDAILDGNGALVLANSAPDTAWNCFSFSNVTGLAIRNLRFRDVGTVDARSGMKALVFQPGTVGISAVRLRDITAQGVLAMVQTQGPYLHTPRVADIAFESGCMAANSYYALCCQNQGDHISGVLTTVNCRRSYLVYGVSGHDLQLFVTDSASRDRAPSRSAVLIKAYDVPTRDLRIRTRFIGVSSLRGKAVGDPGASVMLEVQGSSATQAPVSNVSIEIDDSGLRFDGPAPAAVALSTVDAGGRAVPRPQGVFENIVVATVNDRERMIVLPPGWPRAAGLDVRADPARLSFRSQAMDGLPQR